MTATVLRFFVLAGKVVSYNLGDLYAVLFAPGRGD